MNVSQGREKRFFMFIQPNHTEDKMLKKLTDTLAGCLEMVFVAISWTKIYSFMIAEIYSNLVL